MKATAVTDELIIGDAVSLVNEGMAVTLLVKGRSMLPFILGGHDSVVLTKPVNISVGDVVLARIDGRRYVLHRVVGVRENGYLIRGDNTYADEHVPDAAVIGVLTDFTRKGKKYSTADRRYQRYVRFWCRMYPVRKLLIMGRRLLGRILRKLGLRKPRSA